ncbi:DUF6789 family protein [Halorientalis salina]|uniref:DUF6789 family protein n=1 Tax=Halorientalis salina TaxID=2932266 RepID=UPI0010AB734B|nr:DUF6789 family protein [Halorientalis salina]
MNRPASAILGGAVGTTVMSVMLAIMEVEARGVMGLFDAIARFARVPGNQFLGFVVYAVVGVVVWPLLFLGLERYVGPERDSAVTGMGMGLLLWFGFAVIGRGEVGGVLLMVYLVFTLLAHLAYGFTLGAVYDRLSEEPT